MDDNRVNLELFLTDNTRQGMQSAGQNMTGLEQQMKEVVSVLKQELAGLTKAFKEALSSGISSPADLADIQAMKGAIAELEQQIKDLKKETSSTPSYPKVIDLAPYVTEEVNKLEDVRERVKLIIANIQQDIDGLRSHSVANAGSGIVNSADEAKIKALETTVRGLTEELKKYELAKKSANETPIMQNDPAPKLNSVKMSMAQIARELPTIALGPQMFFLAISNNIPIFTDALSSARKEYERLSAAGQKATPVWKQTLSSLFSFQTALAAAITLTVVYGKEIGEWIKGLFKSKEATLELLSAEQEMALARKKATADSTKERVELDLLYKKLQDATISTNERNAAVGEWIKKYPQHADIMNGEEVSLEKLNIAYQSLTKQIIESAKAKAYFEKTAELQTKKIDADFKRLNQKATLAPLESEYQRTKEIYDKLQKDYEKGKSVGQVLPGARVSYMNAKEEYEKQKDIYDKLEKETNDYVAKINYFATQIKVDDLYTPPKEGTLDYFKRLSEQSKAIIEAIPKDMKIALGQGLNSVNGEKISDDMVKTYKNAMSNLKKANEGISAYDDLNKGYEKKQEKEVEKLRKKQQKNQEKNNEELLSLRRKNQQEEANLMEEGTEKKLAQIKADYDAQSQEIEKRVKELAKRNKEASVKDVNSDGLTTEQQKEIDKANKLNEQNRIKQENEVYKAELQTMWDYLKEYGTFQQKKLAIAEEYNEKIAKSTDEWQKKSLEKQKGASIQQVDINAIKQSVDWGSVFGDFGTMFKDQLQPTIDKLRAISTTDEFKSSSLQEQQILYDLIKKLEQSNAAWDSDIFKRVSDDIIAYQFAMKSYIEAQNREKDAVNALSSAKEALKRLEESGSDTSQAEIKVKQAQESLNSASVYVQEFGAKVKETTSDLESSSANAVNMFHSLESGLQGLASGSLKGIGNGIMQLDKLFNKGDLTKDAGNALASGFQSLLGKDSKASKAITEALGSTGMAGEIVSAILGILDTIAEVGVSGIITSLQDTVLGSIEKMLDDVLSGDIIVKPIKNALSHVGNILDTITFGGFSSWTDGNEKETAEKISALTASNELLRTSIDALKDEIKGNNGSKSISAHNEARDAQKRYEENLRQILDAQMGYHSSHHSNAYYWDLKDSSLSQINNLLGTRLKDSWSDFSKLTADQMNEIRTHLPDIWSEMFNQGKYGDRFKDDWNNYADQAGKVQELTDDLRESLAQISFDSLRDSFVDKLMDMRSDASDFAEDFEEYMTRALLNFSIGDMLDADMKKWYESWTDTMNKQDGKLTEKQIEDYRKQWDDLVNKGLVERDKIAEMTGYTGDSDNTSQSGRSGSIATLTQEQGTKLEGLFTSVQDHTSSIDQLLKDAREERKTMMEILGRIAENTYYCRYLETMNEYLERMYIDGVKMK